MTHKRSAIWKPWAFHADGGAWRLAPAVERLRSGLQIAWAPRGMCWPLTSIPVSWSPCGTPTLDVQAHNIGSDPLPDAKFDLIHTRLVLMHMRERDTALARMVSSLKVGGWLLVEEYDSCSIPPDPALSSGEVLLQTHVAMLRLLEDGGVNRRYGRLLPGLLRKSGLASVGASAQLFMWQSGSAGIAMMRANFEQLREAMIGANYITPLQFEEDLARLTNPSFMTPSSMLWSAWGRRL